MFTSFGQDFFKVSCLYCENEKIKIILPSGAISWATSFWEASFSATSFWVVSSATSFWSTSSWGVSSGPLSSRSSFSSVSSISSISSVSRVF